MIEVDDSPPEAASFTFCKEGFNERSVQLTMVSWMTRLFSRTL